MFGDRLKKLRQSKHLKQNDLAKNLGIGRTTLSNYELNNRQPDFDTLEKIANYFNVSIDYLVGRSNYKTFDEYVFNNDFQNLAHKLKKANKETQKLATDIFDHIYLSTFNYIDTNDVKFLTTLEEIYYCIYRINSDLNSSNKSILLNKLVESDVAVVQDKFKILSKYKNKLSSLLDELFEHHISNNS
ncbi:helix-turn-helix domain-containing protein [Clostridium tyrobutyricum]|uniref:helix-turn-helix domain-containing protein n=1 Tax=Clostridium tyrobutyricum TaxID=1519 RepID=UPI002B20D6D5|nr:helix-turn-helix domain-containing protein [Clostridium tyrobutyricum]MEA5008226.1 helix-turn-helix domain-containing protein [Clostridium tyrobutyricum]